MSMACTLSGFTVAEALAGTTRHAARALGLDDRGTPRCGQRADLAIWSAREPAELCYWLGGDLLDTPGQGRQRVRRRETPLTKRVASAVLCS